jgi:hypothetical protein
VFHNAIRYNGIAHPVGKNAVRLQQTFLLQYNDLLLQTKNGLLGGARARSGPAAAAAAAAAPTSAKAPSRPINFAECGSTMALWAWVSHQYALCGSRALAHS